MKVKFGINMRHFCKEHESLVSSECPSQDLLDYHLEKLKWLQHERLIHLIVLFLTVITFLLMLLLTVLWEEGATYLFAVDAILAVLLIFYFVHYFFLENTVQRWYVIAMSMISELSKDLTISIDF